MSEIMDEVPVHKDPRVFEPKEAHKTTMIVLHGRGDTADRFARPFLASPVTPYQTTGTTEVPGLGSTEPSSFRDYFPNTKFVFPTAPLRRAKAFNRSVISQWFDKWSPQHPELKQYLMVPGLRETSTYLHRLLQQEIDIVGAKNVAFVGISQGCASSLVAALLWEGEPLGAVVGMCGYLPFSQNMADLIKEEQDDEDNPFADTKSDGDESEKQTMFQKAIQWLHEELEMDGESKRTGSAAIQSVPVFMGHGTADTTIPCAQAKQAADFLRAVDVDVEWKEYQGLGHWYRGDMLQDIVVFLQNRDGWGSATHAPRDSEH